MLVLNGTDYTIFVAAGLLAVILFVLQLGFCKYRHPVAKCIPIFLLALAGLFCLALNKGWVDMSTVPFLVEHNVTPTQLWQALALASVGLIAGWIVYAVWRFVLWVILGILHLIWLGIKFILVAIWRLIKGQPVFARPILWPWEKPKEEPVALAQPEEAAEPQEAVQSEPEPAPEPESPYEELLEELPLEKQPEEPQPEEAPTEEGLEAEEAADEPDPVVAK